jgi:microcin C transport system permease protein
MMRLSTQAKSRWLRFQSIRRGYYSFIVFTTLCVLSLFLELLISNRALIVVYEGRWYFPTYGSVISGEEFGLGYQYESNYRDLAEKLRSEDKGWVLLPLVPYGPNEIDTPEGVIPPTAPDRNHYLGTDTVGRDILARLAYGFRIAIVFSFGLLFLEFSIGIIIGSLMGYFGGWFDLLFQRLIEIWSNIPFLYVVMIVASITEPSLPLLIGIMVFFGWTQMTWYMRTETYREKSRDYVLAARSLGASSLRILILHILPNCLSVVITFVPFAIAGGMVSLVSLDFLGFGLPSSIPSLGELLSQGLNHLNSYWIISSVLVTMVAVLTMVTFIGEAIREAFDPKKYAYFR